MSAIEHSPIFGLIIDEPLHIALHVLTVGIAIYVIGRALIAYLRRTSLPSPRFVVLSFLPLVTASVGVWLSLKFMHAVVYQNYMLWNPLALPAGLASASLFLYSGWVCTTLSLLSVCAASRTNVA